jgi:hypothetical protein
MLQKIRKLLCIHSFEYEIGHNIVVKECRKCVQIIKSVHLCNRGVKVPIY